VREAEAKLAVLKKWTRDMSNRTDPLVKQAEQLQGYLAGDMAKAVFYLTEVIKSLQAYTEVAPPPGPAAPPAPSAPEEKGPAA
jgi:hypothetical protein